MMISLPAVVLFRFSAGDFNYSRFLEYVRQFQTSEQREEAIKKAFMTLDKDGSGYIEWNEIKYEPHADLQIRLLSSYIFIIVNKSNKKVKTKVSF